MKQCSLQSSLTVVNVQQPNLSHKKCATAIAYDGCRVSSWHDTARHLHSMHTAHPFLLSCIGLLGSVGLMLDHVSCDDTYCKAVTLMGARIYHLVFGSIPI